MRLLLRSALATAGLVAIAGLFVALPPAAAAGGPVNVLVLKEHGVGSASQAQPYLDKFVALAAKENGWAGASGSYQTTRAGADAYVTAQKPQYGILSLAAFLAFNGKYGVEPIGQAVVSGGGGQQYFIISKNAGNVAGCKGKTLASDHADDARFIDKVVFDGQLKLAEFTLVPTTRMGQAARKVLNDEAECALVDDAQLAELAHLPNAGAVKQAWTSARLPPMVVVAFPGAPAAERTAFAGSLGKLCTIDKATCDAVGLTSLSGGGASAYAGVIAAYNKP